jgi:GNAT superfamily N-acetyltransferase
MVVREHSTSGVTVREIASGESLRAFIDLTWTINRDDPFWVSPLRMSVEAALDRRRHPFHRNADVAYYLAEKSGRTVGRIAAIHNRAHNEFHGDRAGFFGLFECEPDQETADALLGAASRWLRDRGLDRIVGPMNLSTNDEVASPGFLVEGFDSAPTIMMGHNPDYYAGLVTAAGLEPIRDLVTFWFDDPAAGPERGARAMDRILARYRAVVRPMQMKRFRADVDAIKRVYNAAWSRNWGFVPMSDAEFDHLANEFKPIVDPDLCLIAEVDGEPIGFSLALPDINHALRHLPDGRLFPFGLPRFLWYRRKIPSMRVLTLGFTPEYRHAGLGPALYMRTWQTGVSKGYDRGEAGWILDDNHDMVRPLERMGGRAHRRYRIFEKVFSVDGATDQLI